MSSSALVQRKCIQIVLLMTWNIWVSSVNGTDLRFWPGCRAVIPCQSPTFDSDSFKWFYNEFGQNKEIQLYSEDRSGIRRYDASRRRVNITHNRSLVIDQFTEGDQGIYWCKKCKDNVCSEKQSIGVHKEILNEAQRTFFITEGRSFTQTCSDEFSDLKWIFETNKTNQESDRRSDGDIDITNKFIHIASVKSTDAGKYTCWVKRCGGLSRKLLTVNLCVIKVHQNDDSSFSCAVTCNADLNNTKNTSGFPMDHTNISLDLEPTGSLICNASQILDGYKTVTTTSISTTEAGESGKTKHLIPVLYGVSAVIVCLIIITFFIFCLRSRWCTAFPFCFSCGGFSNEEEVESTVIYSSIVIKTPADKRDHGTAERDCLYSEIKL